MQGTLISKYNAAKIEFDGASASDRDLTAAIKQNMPKAGSPEHLEAIKKLTNAINRLDTAKRKLNTATQNIKVAMALSSVEKLHDTSQGPPPKEELKGLAALKAFYHDERGGVKGLVKALKSFYQQNKTAILTTCLALIAGALLLGPLGWCAIAGWVGVGLLVAGLAGLFYLAGGGKNTAAPTVAVSGAPAQNNRPIGGEQDQLIGESEHLGRSSNNGVDISQTVPESTHSAEGIVGGRNSLVEFTSDAALLMVEEPELPPAASTQNTEGQAPRDPADGVYEPVNKFV